MVLERRGARGHPHHRGLRSHRDRPHQAQYPRAVRAHLRAAQARRRAQASLRATERPNADGSVLVPLDMAPSTALDAALDAGAEAIAVCMLHAYLNPEHEHAVADAGGQAPRYARVVLGGRRGRVPRVRALLDHGAECLPAALDERLPGRPRGAPPAPGYTHGKSSPSGPRADVTTETARRLPIRTIFLAPCGGVSRPATGAVTDAQLHHL